MVQASSLVGVPVPSSDQLSARSIISPPTLLASCSISLLLVDGVGGGIILHISGDGGGMGIPGTAGGMPWSAGDVPWWAGGTDGEIVRGRWALLQLSMTA